MLRVGEESGIITREDSCSLGWKTLSNFSSLSLGIILCVFLSQYGFVSGCFGMDGHSSWWN